MSTWGRIAAIAVLVLTGCGGGGSGVSEHAGKLLDAQVDALRATASREDRGATAQQLAMLRASVDELESDGDVSTTAAARIRRAADAVESHLALLQPPTTSTTTTTTTTTTDPPNDGHGDDKDREHKDNGKGNDDERD